MMEARCPYFSQGEAQGLFSAGTHQALQAQGPGDLLLGHENAGPLPTVCCDELMQAMHGLGLPGEDVWLAVSPLELQALGFYGTATPSSYQSNVDPCLGDGKEALEEKDVDHDDGESSGTGDTTMTPPPRTTKRDRARTLVSERKRRGRMKEKLYELRSLVPNITKMDKASIIGDAAMYIRDLQREARALTEEISSLESSPPVPPSTSEVSPQSQPPLRHPKPAAALSADLGAEPSPEPKWEVLQLAACEMGEGRFHVRVEVSGGGEGAPGALHRAMESLTFLRLESSSYFSSDRHEVNFSVKVEEGEMDVSAVKLWVMTALVMEGFHFSTGDVATSS